MAPKPREPRQTNWKNEEEEVLCRATMSISEDPCTGTNQKSQLLWERISEVYETTKPPGACSRTGSSCLGRWKKISPACMRWRQSLNHAIKAHGSGQNEADEILYAKDHYHKLSKGEAFTFFHCWEILKTFKKYMNPPGMDFSTDFEPPIDLDDDDYTPVNESTSSAPPKEARPMGTKAAKAAKKKKSDDVGMSIQTQMQRLNDLREREFAQKQQLIEEAKKAEKREADERTMAVDPSIYSPNKRGYWERRQKKILDMEKMENESSNTPQFHPQSSSSNDDASKLSLYIPVQDTPWI